MAILTEHRRRFRRYPGLDGLPEFCVQFAAALGGWIAGFGVLRICSAILTMSNDLARETLVARYYPLWQSLGWLLLAWLAYRLFKAAGDGVNVLLDGHAAPRTAKTESDTERPTPPTASLQPIVPPSPSSTTTPADWRDRIKMTQKSKDVWKLLDLRGELHAAWPEKRRAWLDRQLGRWFTKYFQCRLQRGQADQVLPELTRVAEIYDGHPEFKFFGEALPTIRESVETRAAILAELAAEDAAAKPPPTADGKA